MPANTEPAKYVNWSAAGVLGASIVTTLPQSPVDGQIIYFIAEAAIPVVWTFRFRGASASTHKWEFIGGSVLTIASKVGAEQEIVPPTKPVVATGSPGIEFPFPGDYLIQAQCTLVYRAKAAAQVFVWPIKDATHFFAFQANSERGFVSLGPTAGSSNFFPFNFEQIIVGASAGDVAKIGIEPVLGAEAIKLQTFGMRLGVLPVRIG